MEIDKFSTEQITQIKEIGSYLHSRREELSLSLEQISGGTQISLRVLRALESGNYQKLPEPIYLRGLIRLYGNALRIDGTALAKSLSKNTVSFAAEPEPEPEPEPESGTDIARTEKQKPSFPKIQTPKKAWFYLLYIILLVGAVYGLFSFLRRAPVDQKAIEKPSTSPVKTPPPTPKSTTTLPPTSPTPKSTTTPPATEASEKTAPVSVKLNLEADSWLQVKVDGKTEFEGILSKGTEKNWTAKKQITIRAGNAGAIKLSQNQEPSKLLGGLGEVKDVTVTPKN